MTENNHHDSATLDKLTEPFTVLPNDNPASDAKRQELIDKPAFGQVFSDNMAHMSWTKGEGWGDRRIEPYAPLKLDPGASVLHYAQEVFEGLKAYRHADGSTWLFRPDANAERFQNSAKRLYLPELNGCEQVCFVDAATKTYLEELGGMNMMVVHKDGHVETPSLTGNILPGVTRRSLIQLMQDRGIDVVETMIKLTDLLDDIKSGEVTEVFACGTAAIITPIGRFKSKEFDVTVANGESGKLTVDLRDQLLGIQLGEVEDPHNWMWKVC